jgi:murein L,D-transpeptidase YcbB/YkuD
MPTRSLLLLWILLTSVVNAASVGASSAPTGTGGAASTVEAALIDLRQAPPPGRPVANEAAVVETIYERRANRPLWSEQARLTSQAVQLSDRLRAAADDGLVPDDYAAQSIAVERERLSSPVGASDADWARFDAVLTCAAVRLVTHLHYGRIDPRAAGFELTQPRNDLDVADVVAALAAAAQVNDVLGGVEPAFYHYGLLKTALARYRALQSNPTLTQLPPLGRRTLHAGDAYADAGALRRLLAAVGDLPGPPGDAPAPDSLDADLVDGLKRFQERHGLNPDGSLGPQTFVELTTSFAQRVRQIELTLERWRWLPPFDRPPIIVNIPQFDLFAFQGTADRAAAIMTMKVIVGQAYPRTETPVFTGELQYVIFRPYWDIPRSILLREMLPGIRRRPGYLEQNHLEIVRGESDAAPVLPPSADAIAALAAGQARLRQRPGEDNALGLIKFLFPNAHNVYLHSTPADRLFLQSRRAFSHGCIRVSDPVALAHYVLRNAPGVWDDAHILAAMHGADAVRITLRSPIPVMILYGTVQATEAGPIQFFDDLYGHDAKLQALLGLHSTLGVLASPDRKFTAHQ